MPAATNHGQKFSEAVATAQWPAHRHQTRLENEPPKPDPGTELAASIFCKDLKKARELSSSEVLTAHTPKAHRLVSSLQRCLESRGVRKMTVTNRGTKAPMDHHHLQSALSSIGGFIPQLCDRPPQTLQSAYLSHLQALESYYRFQIALINRYQEAIVNFSSERLLPTFLLSIKEVKRSLAKEVREVVNHLRVEYLNSTNSRQGKLSDHAQRVLRAWFFSNLRKPYPSEMEKKDLCQECRITPSQLNTWFGNSRIRFKRSMEEENTRQERAKKWQDIEHNEIDLDTCSTPGSTASSNAGRRVWQVGGERRDGFERGGGRRTTARKQQCSSDDDYDDYYEEVRPRVKRTRRTKFNAALADMPVPIAPSSDPFNQGTEHEGMEVEEVEPITTSEPFHSPPPSARSAFTSTQIEEAKTPKMPHSQFFNEAPPKFSPVIETYFEETATLGDAFDETFDDGSQDKSKSSTDPLGLGNNMSSFDQFPSLAHLVSGDRDEAEILATNISADHPLEINGQRPDDQFWKKSGDDPRAGIPSPSAPSNPFSPMAIPRQPSLFVSPPQPHMLGTVFTPITQPLPPKMMRQRSAATTAPTPDNIGPPGTSPTPSVGSQQAPTPEGRPPSSMSVNHPAQNITNPIVVQLGNETHVIGSPERPRGNYVFSNMPLSSLQECNMETPSPQRKITMPAAPSISLLVQNGKVTCASGTMARRFVPTPPTVPKDRADNCSPATTITLNSQDTAWWGSDNGSADSNHTLNIEETCSIADVVAQSKIAAQVQNSPSFGDSQDTTNFIETKKETPQPDPAASVNNLFDNIFLSESIHEQIASKHFDAPLNFIPNGFGSSNIFRSLDGTQQMHDPFGSFSALNSMGGSAWLPGNSYGFHGPNGSACAIRNTFDLFSSANAEAMKNMGIQ